MPTDLLTVESFWSIEEAQLARGFLESEGIPCQLEGLATAGNCWHLSNATGGVKLQTSPQYVERAVELLHNVQHAASSHTDELDSDSADGMSPVTESSEAVDDHAPGEVTTEADEGSYRSTLETFRKHKWLLVLVLFAPALFFPLLILPSHYLIPLAITVLIAFAFLKNRGFLSSVETARVGPDGNHVTDQLIADQNSEFSAPLPQLSLESLGEDVRKFWPLLLAVAAMIVILMFAWNIPV